MYQIYIFAFKNKGFKHVGDFILEFFNDFLALAAPSSHLAAV
jgi:hypothetical protein